MTTLNKRFGKAKSGCAAERRYVFAQLEDVEYQINQVHITGIEPVCVALKLFVKFVMGIVVTSKKCQNKYTN